MKRDMRRSERIIARVLGAGSGLSIVIMTAGMLLLLAKGGAGKPAGFPGLHYLFNGVAALEPAAIMTLGILVLMFTPVCGIIAAGILLMILERDRKFALVSLGVLIILAAGFFVPGFN